MFGGGHISSAREEDIMGKYDAAVCRFLTDRDRFAELINASEFQGRQVLRGDM